MGGPCSNILCISFLPLWYPWGPTFHDTTFHPVRIGTRLVFLAYVPVKPNMFSVSDPSNIVSILSRLWIQEPTLVLRARKNLSINFQECLGAWVRQCLVVSPSGMASQSSSSESQSLRLSWRDLILGKIRVWSDPSNGVILGSCKVGSSYVPRFPTALTTSSIESVASVFRKMQSDRSIGAHVWELGVVSRSACNIPFGIDLFRQGSGAHDWRNFPMSSRVVPSIHLRCIMSRVAS